MHVIRFVFPFLFVRNWYDGSWQLSRARLFLSLMGVLILGIGISIAYILQAPVEYMSTP